MTALRHKLSSIRKRWQQAGVTLVELSVVLVIFGLLSWASLVCASACDMGHASAMAASSGRRRDFKDKGSFGAADRFFIMACVRGKVKK